MEETFGGTEQGKACYVALPFSHLPLLFLSFSLVNLSMTCLFLTLISACDVDEKPLSFLEALYPFLKHPFPAVCFGESNWYIAGEQITKYKHQSCQNNDRLFCKVIKHGW